jgi:hypothetical protein
VHSIEELVSATAQDRTEYVFCVDDPMRAVSLLHFLPKETMQVDEENRLHVTLFGADRTTILAQINRMLIMGDVALYTVSQKENRKH